MLIFVCTQKLYYLLTWRCILRSDVTHEVSLCLSIILVLGQPPATWEFVFLPCFHIFNNNLSKQEKRLDYMQKNHSTWVIPFSLFLPYSKTTQLQDQNHHGLFECASVCLKVLPLKQTHPPWNLYFIDLSSQIYYNFKTITFTGFSKI